MRNDKRNYMLVGVFTLAMLVLLIAVLFRLTGRNSEADYYYSSYSKIAGIKIGSAVSYGGYRIGQVDAIRPIRKGNKTHFELTLAIKKNWKIPKGSTARIISPGMLSDKQVDIEEIESTEYFKPGDHIQGKEEANFMAILNSVAVEVQEVSEESIKPFLEILKKHTDKIGGSLSKELPEMIIAAKKVMNDLGKSIESVKLILNEDNASDISASIGNIKAFSERLKSMSSDFSDVRVKLNRLLENANKTVIDNRQDLRASIIDMKQVMNAIADSINSITYNLEGASRNMNEFSRQIRENPGLLLGGQPQSDQSNAK